MPPNPGPIGGLEGGGPEPLRYPLSRCICGAQNRQCKAQRHADWISATFGQPGRPSGAAQCPLAMHIDSLPRMAAFSKRCLAPFKSGGSSRCQAPLSGLQQVPGTYWGGSYRSSRVRRAGWRKSRWFRGNRRKRAKKEPNSMVSSALHFLRLNPSEERV